MRTHTLPTQDEILNDIVDCKIFDNRIIVAGTRGYDDYESFATTVKELIAGVKGNIIFLSGMAKTGADKLIIDFCKNEGYLHYPYPADWDRFGKGAGFIRNSTMADNGTWLIAFHDGISNGTAHMIKVAKEKELRINVININQVDEGAIAKLYTIQVPHWRLANQLGIKFIDITAKSGIQAFAPDMENVMAYKSGQMSQEDYTRFYRDKMFVSQKTNEKFWKHLLKFPVMAFGCYCPPGEFCHRHLFIEIAKEYLERFDVKVELCGEITKEFVEQEVAKTVQITQAK